MKLKELFEETYKHYPWQVTSNEELLKLPGWKRDNDNGGLYFQVDGEMYINGKFDDLTKTFTPYTYYEQEIVDDMLVEYQGNKYLPFQLAIWPTECNIINSDLNSFIILPNKINGDLRIANTIFKDMEECPSIITQNFIFDMLPIRYRLSNYIKEAKYITMTNNTDNNISYKGFLSFLKIHNLRFVQTLGSLTLSHIPAAKIINRHLKSGRNINKCKSELIEAGLEEYAQL